MRWSLTNSVDADGVDGVQQQYAVARVVQEADVPWHEYSKKLFDGNQPNQDMTRKKGERLILMYMYVYEKAIRSSYMYILIWFWKPIYSNSEYSYGTQLLHVRVHACTCTYMYKLLNISVIAFQHTCTT